MRIEPIGNRVVLEINKKEKKEVSGIIIVESEGEKLPTGKIIAISKEIKNKDLFSIGDEVLYEDYKGKLVKSDDKEILIIDSNFILGIIE